MVRKDKESFLEKIFSLVYKEWIDVGKTQVLADEVFESMRSLLKLLDQNIEETRSSWLRFVALKNKVPEAYVSDFITSLNPELHLSDLNEEKIKKQLEWLKNQPHYPQKSDEWFKFRNGGITASAAYKVLSGLPSDYDYLLKEKVIASQEFKQLTGKACSHGILYEEVAQYIYQRKFKVKIEEYGCIRHKSYSHILSSPDGIVNNVEDDGDRKMLGRMLEIKCPYSRVLNGLPLYSYFVQCQLQLEVCDLEYCDFYECVFKEYTEIDFMSIFEKTPPLYYGVVIQYIDESVDKSGGGKKETKYFYPLEDDDVKSFQTRIQTEIDLILLDYSNNVIKYSYWVLEQNNIVTIKRDRAWFESVRGKIKDFWDTVERKKKENLLFGKQNILPAMNINLLDENQDTNKMASENTGNTLLKKELAKKEVFLGDKILSELSEFKADTKIKKTWLGTTL
jgi:putative phage-type endonuclease